MSVSRRLGRRECFDFSLFWKLWDAGNYLSNEGYNQRAPLRDTFFGPNLLIFRTVLVDGSCSLSRVSQGQASNNSSLKPVPW